MQLFLKDEILRKLTLFMPAPTFILAASNSLRPHPWFPKMSFSVMTPSPLEVTPWLLLSYIPLPRSSTLHSVSTRTPLRLLHEILLLAIRVSWELWNTVIPQSWLAWTAFPMIFRASLLLMYKPAAIKGQAHQNQPLSLQNFKKSSAQKLKEMN